MALTLLNQIFYNTNKFDVDPTLCGNFMYLDSYAKNIKPIVIMNSVEPIVQTEKPKQESYLFSPKKHDQLFWSIYVLFILPCDQNNEALLALLDICFSRYTMLRN